MIIHTMPQYSDEWWRVRLGKPTASDAKKMMRTVSGGLSDSIDGYAQGLAADLFAGEYISGFKGQTPAMKRGTMLEPMARSYYQLETYTECFEVGFVTNDLMTYGCSPDSLVEPYKKASNDATFYRGGVEIKCAELKGHLSAVYAWYESGVIPKEHLAQCWMQMMTCELEWIDLVLFHPNLPSAIIRIDKDAEKEQSLKAAINHCLALRKAETVRLTNLKRLAA